VVVLLGPLSPLSVLDFVTIMPGLVTLVLSSALFNAQAFIVSQTLRVFRVFRVVRLMRIITLSTSSSLTRQFAVLAVTVLAMVFAAAAIFQILDSTPDHFVPFHVAVLYMTITIIGRPPVPTQTDASLEHLEDLRVAFMQDAVRCAARPLRGAVPQAPSPLSVPRRASAARTGCLGASPWTR
jgi:hypothetical protein